MPDTDTESASGLRDTGGEGAGAQARDPNTDPTPDPTPADAPVEGDLDRPSEPLPEGAAPERAEELKKRAEDAGTALTRAEALAAIAGDYGDRALRNYAQVRNAAINLRDQLRDYLCTDRECVFLVPPRGKFGARDYGSGAYSVSGKGFLPLEPISFGLAVRVSGRKDYIRIVMTARIEAEQVTLTPDNGKPYRLGLPLSDAEFREIAEDLYDYLIDWFASRIDRYDHGRYGNTDIGFDIIRAAQ